MEKYNYREAMVNDIKDWILSNNIPYYQENIEDQLNEDLWAESSVTGNGASYYASEERCNNYVSNNLSLYFEAARELCDFPTSHCKWIYQNPAQHMDSTIRCYLLYECINIAIEQLNSQAMEDFFAESQP